MCCVLSRSVVSDSLWPHGLLGGQTPLSMGILQVRILEWVVISPSRESSQPRYQTQVSRIAGGFFTIWAGKPKNTGVGSLSLLQGIFLTQKSNHGLLHCRWIFYQLSYQDAHKVKLKDLLLARSLLCRGHVHNGRVGVKEGPVWLQILDAHQDHQSCLFTN